MPNSMPSKVPRDEEFEKLADHTVQQGIENLKRYAGHPDLLMKEHPHRDLRKLAQKLHGQPKPHAGH